MASTQGLCISNDIHSPPETEVRSVLNVGICNNVCWHEACICNNHENVIMYVWRTVTGSKRFKINLLLKDQKHSVSISLYPPADLFLSISLMLGTQSSSSHSPCVWIKWIYVQIWAAAKSPDAVCSWTSLHHVCIYKKQEEQTTPC